MVARAEAYTTSRVPIRTSALGLRELGDPATRGTVRNESRTLTELARELSGRTDASVAREPGRELRAALRFRAQLVDRTSRRIGAREHDRDDRREHDGGDRHGAERQDEDTSERRAPGFGGVSGGAVSPSRSARSQLGLVPDPTHGLHGAPGAELAA